MLMSLRGFRLHLFAMMVRTRDIIRTNETEQNLMESIKQMSLQTFSMKVRQMLVQDKPSPMFWACVESQFLSRIQPTTDQNTIRSYSRIIYSLSKSKRSSTNYENKVGLWLPFASAKSFAEMVTSLSRMGPLSQEMGYIVEKFYYKKKSQLSLREIINVNYTLVNNGRPLDPVLIQKVDGSNCVETVLILRAYQMCDLHTPQILNILLRKFIAVKQEINVLDLADIVNIFLAVQYVPPQFQELIEQSYVQLRTNFNQIAILKLWKHIPNALNQGKLKIKFVLNVVNTIRILKKNNDISKKGWKQLSDSFQKIQNLEVKSRLLAIRDK